MSGDRHDMSDAEWEILRSFLPRKHHGPRRVHDRRVMNGIFFVLQHRHAVARPPGALRPLHDLLQPLQPVERERHLGVDHGEASRPCGR
ncbi:MAG: transposase [Boseongicola sp. SB0664_bin_43]|uniref:Transposase n=1 Tax=Boseongicola sp. SB0664_bin_43 TaxID=2604844 RepID=A0A6B0XYR3_9RHOB|nr:transposase [Boseongicola sp. SB0664_bin_43]